MLFHPLLGWRHVMPTEQRTARDFAEVLRYLAEDLYPEAERLMLVTDNLNTHTPGGLYEAFEPARARAIATRIEWHYTPKHGSWLNVAECEFSVLSRQCLARRIADIGELRRRVETRENARNDRLVGAKWRFTTADARIKLHRLYPSTQ